MTNQEIREIASRIKELLSRISEIYYKDAFPIRQDADKKWDKDEHPRGEDGKFIRGFGLGMDFKSYEDSPWPRDCVQFLERVTSR